MAHCSQSDRTSQDLVMLIEVRYCNSVVEVQNRRVELLYCCEWLNLLPNEAQML